METATEEFDRQDAEDEKIREAVAKVIAAFKPIREDPILAATAYDVQDAEAQREDAGESLAHATPAQLSHLLGIAYEVDRL